MLKINDLERHHAPLLPDLSRVATEVLSKGWYVLGPRVEAFERAFAEYCGTAHAVGVGNGTDALEIALRALCIAPGDEVVTVANAGMYSSVAIDAVGATPVFVDVDAASMSMAPRLLEASLTARTKAIVLTHLYGRLADVGEILAIAEARRVPVVEDCAQAHGARLADRRAGSFGALGCFSFYPTKNLGACGDGGAITTSNPELAERARRLRQYGWSEKYRAVLPGGRNTRLDELQAAFLSLKLPHLEAWNSRRWAIGQRYTAELRHPDIVAPSIESGRHVAHLYVVRSRGRDALREHLRHRGIGAEIHYPLPDHHQAIFAARHRNTSLPVTELLAKEVLTLPCFPEMTDREVSEVIEACNTWTG